MRPLRPGRSQAYLAHPALGKRLCEAVRAMLAHRPAPAAHILGELDALQFRSCLTLFQQAAPAQPLFGEALEVCFAGQPDPDNPAAVRARMLTRLVASALGLAVGMRASALLGAGTGAVQCRLVAGVLLGAARCHGPAGAQRPVCCAPGRCFESPLYP